MIFHQTKSFKLWFFLFLPRPEIRINWMIPSRIFGARVISRNALIFIWSTSETQYGCSWVQGSVHESCFGLCLTWPRMKRPPFFMSFTKSIRSIEERGLATSSNIFGRQNLTCSLRGSRSKRYFRTWWKINAWEIEPQDSRGNSRKCKMATRPIKTPMETDA